MFLHGLAGDFAALEAQDEHTVLATDTVGASGGRRFGRVLWMRMDWCGWRGRLGSEAENVSAGLNWRARSGECFDFPPGAPLRMTTLYWRRFHAGVQPR